MGDVMDINETVRRFREAGLGEPTCAQSSAALLAEYVSSHSQILTPSEIEMFVGVGGQLMQQGVEDWWNHSSYRSVEADTFGTSLVTSGLIRSTVTVSEPRQFATVSEIQTLLINRQQQYSPCLGLTFDAPRWKEPDSDGCNWEIEPVPSRNNVHSPRPTECFSLMEGYIHELQAAFCLSNQRASAVVN
jgi:hypothetical protein